MGLHLPGLSPDVVYVLQDLFGGLEMDVITENLSRIWLEIFDCLLKPLHGCCVGFDTDLMVSIYLCRK